MDNKKAQSLVAIMIVVAVIALFLRIFIGQFLESMLTQNESEALSSLKLVSAALENYAKDHLGAYPESLDMLLKAQPPYLDKDYSAQGALRGYLLECPRTDPTGYSCVSAPARCNFTGRKKYAVTTAGVFSQENCFKAGK